MNLLFDFTVDKAAKTVFITREFAAGIDLVWDAFTKPELLDQWGAPAPYTAKTKYMHFATGGKRFYAMISPDGTASWIIQQYTSITPKTNFKLYNAFSDENENPQLPGSEWDFSFSEQDGITKVRITIFNESFERMEKLLDGFRQGYTATLKNLENILHTKTNKMNRLQFDFLVDKERNTLTIRREFAAERQLVWDCYTKQELLDQWFAPKPFTTKTKSMDFRNGGHWHYAMIDQQGNHYWGYTTYNNIKPIDYYETADAFCNEAGEINAELPTAKWEVSFSDKSENTLVETVVYYASLNDLETIINMGMQEGMMLTLEKLDELLLTLAGV